VKQADKIAPPYIFDTTYLYSGQDKSKITLNGRVLLRRPRLYHSCSAIEEEDIFIQTYFIP
jgi:hypothetical protein